jgi:glycerol-3-phosphate dehydrogenase (NAD(P)+)
MRRIVIGGAGAFGTALAVAYARDGAEVVLWARDPARARDIAVARENRARLPGVPLPDAIEVVTEFPVARADAILLAMPMQEMAGFLGAVALGDGPLVACSKGVSLETLEGPATLLARLCPGAEVTVLSGPGFAADIARELPTGLTLAAFVPEVATRLQQILSTPALRLYSSADPVGVELGGALKNVVAIAAGIAIGAGLGDSARAALITRGHAEMLRVALARGALAQTLSGLSGFGDLVLTCTSEKSRNFRFGLALGAGQPFDAATTVEGAASARAMARLAAQIGVEMPITAMVAAVIDGHLGIAQAVEALMARPLKEE